MKKLSVFLPIWMTMNKIKLIAACFLILFGMCFLYSDTANAWQSKKRVVVYIKNPQKTSVHYPGVIYSTGIGKPPRSGKTSAQKRLLAERAAKVVAYRNLVKASNELKPVFMDTGTLYVDGFLKGAQVSQKRYMSDGTVEVDMRLNVNLKGGVEHPVAVETVEEKIESIGYPVGILDDTPQPVTSEEMNN